MTDHRNDLNKKDNQDFPDCLFYVLAGSPPNNSTGPYERKIHMGLYLFDFSVESEEPGVVSSGIPVPGGTAF